MVQGMATFSSDKKPLGELLRDIKTGAIQLPDFQRGWVWDEDRIRGLLASVSLSYPIGAVMMLEGGNPDIMLKCRPVEGADVQKNTNPELIILDGQQRLTALYQSLLASKPVVTVNIQHPKKELRRWFYIDMAKSLDPKLDREDAIVILPEEKQLKNFRGEVIQDFSTNDREYKANLFPFSQLFDHTTWRRNYNEFWDYDKDKIIFFDKFESEVIKRFEGYHIPLIVLKKETLKEAVCNVFEKVNTGGVSLTVFELLTAMFSTNDFNLRDDWDARSKRIKRKVLADHPSTMEDIENTDYLQVVSLLSTYQKKMSAIEGGLPPENAPAISCKRKDILGLTLGEYLQQDDAATRGFERAVKFLHSQFMFSPRDIPYTKQAVPLSAIMAVLGDRVEEEGVRLKIAQWFWCGIFGELYGSAIESRFAKDLPEVLAWIDGGATPSTVAEANFNPPRLLTMKTRNSAAYKGVYALLMRKGCLDFKSGHPLEINTFFDEDMDIHHIFPKEWCEKIGGVDASVYNSIINKTAISSTANRKIGGNAPSRYLERGQKDWGIAQERMDDILRSHLINPEALRKDAFDEFFESRRSALLELISEAMGKAPNQGQGIMDVPQDDSGNDSEM